MFLTRGSVIAKSIYTVFFVDIITLRRHRHRKNSSFFDFVILSGANIRKAIAINEQVLLRFTFGIRITERAGCIGPFICLKEINFPLTKKRVI